MEREETQIISQYAQEVSALYMTGVTTEHSFRSSLQVLLNNILPQLSAINEPQRTECGAPDFALIGRENGHPYAYVEAKDLFDNDLRGMNPKRHKEQFDRYKQALCRVCFTNYLEFRFYAEGEETEAVTPLRLNGRGGFEIVEGERFVSVLREWANGGMQPITTAQRLAEVMAGKARMLEEALRKTLLSGRDSEIMGEYRAFKKVLLHDLTEERFSDLYAQTIVYGLFAARLNDSEGESFTREKAAKLIPMSNQFLRRIFQQIAGYDLDKGIAWVVDDLAEAFAHSDVLKIMGKYGEEETREDPLIHFYEDFLAAYDPNLREICGVYYTPKSVVNFIVRAVDEILEKDFGLKDGLADASRFKHFVLDPATNKKQIERESHKVQILDPATGTGAFLAEVAMLIKRRFGGNSGFWRDYVKESLLPRLNGFELLMAPYTITHLKLDMILGLGEENEDLHPHIYLTNSLEEHHPDSETLFAQWLSRESERASEIKRDYPVMVMIGNPPYSGESQNKGKWITDLMEDYKREPGGKERLREKNPKWINDDYVKFIRMAQDYIERNEQGVIGFINPHGYLDSPTFRGMRWKLMQTFDKIYTINMHGNGKKKEVCPDGSPDENMFDIMQGVSINLFVKTGKKKKGSMGKVFHADLYGKRSAKNEFLYGHSLYGRNAVGFEELKPKAPMYYFVPKDWTMEREYKKGVSVVELFGANSVNVVTGRDSFVVKFAKEDIETDVKRFLSISDEEAREVFDLGKDARDWTVARARKDLANGKYKVTEFQYRPFDKRYVPYTGKSRGIMSYPRHTIMKNMLRGNNMGLVLNRQIRNNISHPYFVVDKIADLHIFETANASAYLFPLYVYEKKKKMLNINDEMLERLVGKVVKKSDIEGDRLKIAEDAFAYIYAVLHSPTYRETFKEFLKIDFPRIPVPTDEAEYRRLAGLGKRLIELHLTKDNGTLAGGENLPTYPIEGTDVVDRVRYKDGRVYINETQYFEGVSRTAWEFYVGGYQPAQKWLKDRKGRKLGWQEANWYRRVIGVMEETDAIMKEIG